MSHAMKKLVCLLVVLATFASSSALACTGFYVGKEASADGTTIIGHTVDAWTTAQSMEIVVPRVENEPGRVMTISDEASWPLPDTTYQYTATPFLDGSYQNAVANEMGVAVTGSITCYVRDEIAELDPTVRNGLSETWLCGLVGACCATAREGVELLAEVIETIGNSEHNTIFIADQNEAWYMETYTGHQWCAVKMPEDCVAVFGNEFMLGAVDPESEDVLYSDELFSMPEEAGLAVYTEDGLMDLFATYSGNDSLSNGNNRRTWYGHVLFAPSTAGEYERTKRYDLFYKPDEPITLEQVFEMTRSRYEGTEFCPETTGRIDQRVIATERQVNVGAIQIYDDLPAAMSCVTWTCLANAEHSVYLPLSNLITDVAESYRYSPEEVGYNPDIPHVSFKRLCALSEQDRYHYGTGVRNYWYGVEQDLIATYPEVLAETLALYESDPEAAAESITAYTIELQEKALADANQMYDELTWYMIANTNTLRYDVTNGDIEEWEPFVPSLAQTVDTSEDAAA